MSWYGRPQIGTFAYLEFLHNYTPHFCHNGTAKTSVLWRIWAKSLLHINNFFTLKLTWKNSRSPKILTITSPETSYCLHILCGMFTYFEREIQNSSKHSDLRGILQRRPIVVWFHWSKLLISWRNKLFCKMAPPGIEPAISHVADERLSHSATMPRYFKHQNLLYLYLNLNISKFAEFWFG